MLSSLKVLPEAPEVAEVEQLIQSLLDQEHQLISVRHKHRLPGTSEISLALRNWKPLRLVKPVRLPAREKCSITSGAVVCFHLSITKSLG